ncbi:hypothetical protein BDF19DRAFT_90542 [Syncephalis fuscata]|nr:hypothetical protein BDF19DRAFT_90542 [Syncephalis fuscata]
MDNIGGIQKSDDAQPTETTSAAVSDTVMNSCRLFVGNLPAEATEYKMIKLCQQYGKIAKLDFLYHKEGPMAGKPRNYCFVEYATHKEAHVAMQYLNGRKFYGRQLGLSWFKPIKDTKDRPRQHRGTPYDTASHGLSATLQRNQKMAHSSVDTRIKALERKLAQLSKNTNQSTSKSS